MALALAVNIVGYKADIVVVHKEERVAVVVSLRIVFHNLTLA